MIDWLPQLHVTISEGSQSTKKTYFRVASGECEYRKKRSRIQLILLKRHRSDGFFIKENQTGAEYLLSRAEFHFLSLISLCEEGRGKKKKKNNVGEKGQKNCTESKDKASKELSKLLTDQICHRHVISKWSLNVQSIKKYPSPWPLERA